MELTLIKTERWAKALSSAGLVMALLTGAALGVAAKADPVGAAVDLDTKTRACAEAHAESVGALRRVDEAMADDKATHTLVAGLQAKPRATIGRLLGSEVDPFGNARQVRLIDSGVADALDRFSRGDAGWQAEVRSVILSVLAWHGAVLTTSVSSSLPAGHPCKLAGDKVDELGQKSWELQGKLDDCINPAPPPGDGPPIGFSSEGNEGGENGGEGNGGGEGENRDPCKEIEDEMREVDLQYIDALGAYVACMDIHGATGSNPWQGG